MNVWFWLLVVGEIAIGVLFVLGIFTRVAAVIAVVIMLGAIHTKGRGEAWFVDKDFIILILAIVVALVGNGTYSLQKRCCSVCNGSCASAEKK